MAVKEVTPIQPGGRRVACDAKDAGVPCPKPAVAYVRQFGEWDAGCLDHCQGWGVSSMDLRPRRFKERGL